jgi:hypothetical protein
MTAHELRAVLAVLAPLIGVLITYLLAIAAGVGDAVAPFVILAGVGFGVRVELQRARGRCPVCRTPLTASGTCPNGSCPGATR